jgi:hypothetical protein
MLNLEVWRGNSNLYAGEEAASEQLPHQHKGWKSNQLQIF